jgi:hypothetical protein
LYQKLRAEKTRRVFSTPVEVRSALGEQPAGLTDARWRREDFQAAKLIFAKER